MQKIFIPPILKFTARRLAEVTMKSICKSSFTSNVMGVGCFFVPVQKGAVVKFLLSKHKHVCACTHTRKHTHTQTHTHTYTHTHTHQHTHTHTHIHTHTHTYSHTLKIEFLTVKHTGHSYKRST